MLFTSALCVIKRQINERTSVEIMVSIVEQCKYDSKSKCGINCSMIAGYFVAMAFPNARVRRYGESVDLALASAERREKDKKKKEEKERMRSPREILRSTRILLHRYSMLHRSAARAAAVQFSFVRVLLYYDRNSVIRAMVTKYRMFRKKKIIIYPICRNNSHVFIEPSCS